MYSHLVTCLPDVKSLLAERLKEPGTRCSSRSSNAQRLVATLPLCQFPAPLQLPLRVPVLQAPSRKPGQELQVNMHLLAQPHFSPWLG